MNAVRRVWGQLRQPRDAQTLVIFALGMSVLLGSLGLALDVGYDFALRRTLQNGADAAALAGARGVLYGVAPVNSDALTVAIQSGFPDPASPPPGGSSNFDCEYIDNSLAEIGDCATAIPASASGVVVTVKETHATFVMRVLGITTSGTRATATAQVQTLSTLDGGKAPFVVCGIDTAVTTPSGSTFSILNTSGTYASGYTATQESAGANGYDEVPTVKSNAFYYQYASGGLSTINYGTLATPIYGPEYIIHGSQISYCNDTSSSWKGQNINNGPITLTRGSYSPPGYSGTMPPASQPGPPTILVVNTGVVAGPTRDIAGVQGCAAGQMNDCVMVLPIADNSGPGGSGANAKLAVRKFGAFYVTETSPNEHHGKLIKDYPGIGTGSGTWNSGSSDPAVVRLIR